VGVGHVWLMGWLTGRCCKVVARCCGRALVGHGVLTQGGWVYSLGLEVCWGVRGLNQGRGRLSSCTLVLCLCFISPSIVWCCCNKAALFSDSAASWRCACVFDAQPVLHPVSPCSANAAEAGFAGHSMQACVGGVPCLLYLFIGSLSSLSLGPGLGGPSGAFKALYRPVYSMCVCRVTIPKQQSTKQAAATVLLIG